MAAAADASDARVARTGTGVRVGGCHAQKRRRRPDGRRTRRPAGRGRRVGGRRGAAVHVGDGVGRDGPGVRRARVRAGQARRGGAGPVRRAQAADAGGGARGRPGAGPSGTGRVRSGRAAAPGVGHHQRADPARGVHRTGASVCRHSSRVYRKTGRFHF